MPGGAGERVRMEVLDTFLDAMGDTPLVRLHAVTGASGPQSSRSWRC